MVSSNPWDDCLYHIVLGLSTHACMYVRTHVVYVCVNHHGDGDRGLSCTHDLSFHMYTQLQ